MRGGWVRDWVVGLRGALGLLLRLVDSAGWPRGGAGMGVNVGTGTVVAVAVEVVVDVGDDGGVGIVVDSASRWVTRASSAKP